MKAEVSGAEVARLRSILTAALGLHLDDVPDARLVDLLVHQAGRRRRSPSDYLDALAGGPFVVAREEWAVLTAELTVPESHFFRHRAQFDALVRDVLPEVRARRAGSRTLRILSAGCASGEEAYTLAIVLRDALDPSWRLSVVAVDINPIVLDRARRGRFSPWALRATPADVVDRWFERHGRTLELDPRIRAAVRFEHRNLCDPASDLWVPESFDVVFCRNVLMYLEPTQAAGVVARLAASLVPGGHLFLGHAENLRELSTDFDVRHEHGTFYYRRKGALASPPDPESTSPDAPAIGTLAGEAAWFDAISHATDRVRQLTHRSAAGPPGADQTVTWDLNEARVLLHDERYDEALAALASLPRAADADPDVLLLRGVLQAHTGSFDDAAATCRRLLAADATNAGAHYVLALCCDGAGDLAGVAEHDQLAAHLEPTFAMPRLHLGLVARRAGDLETSRRMLSEAMTVLPREEQARLLLFGGGFDREALARLCEAELSAAGGAS